MPTGPTHQQLMAEIAKAIRNRDKWALKADALLDQGKTDEAREMLSRAEYWELERKSLEKKRRIRRETSPRPRTGRRKP